MKRLLLAAMTAALLTLLPGTARAQATDTGTVTVLHGVPGLAVDVYVNGELLIPGFEPGDQFGPAELPAGDYDIAIRGAGAAPDAEPALASTVTVPAGVNATAIAHLDAGGDPTLGVFVNDVSRIPAGDTRVTVRHTAAFGAVDVLAGGAPVFEAVTNPAEGSLEVAAGTYPIAVTAAGDPATEAFAADISFEAGTAYFVHAIGDPAAGTFDLLVQTVDGLGAEVLGVSTGSGGLLADDTGMSTAAAFAIAAAVLAVTAVPAVAIARRR